MTTEKRREIAWLAPAKRDFDAFPLTTRRKAFRALDLVARGDKPDVAKPLKGFGSGVWELALKDRGDAFRNVYAVQIGEEIWIIHAFQKKSTSGIATPKRELDLVHERLKRLNR